MLIKKKKKLSTVAQNKQTTLYFNNRKLSDKITLP